MKSTETDVLDLLREHEFLAGLGETHFQALAPMTTVIEYAADERINRAGDEATAVYLVQDGHVGVEIRDPARGKLEVQTLRSGDVFGWSSLIPPYRWTFDVVAYEATRVLAIDGRAFRHAMETDHELGYQLLNRFTSVFAERLRAARLQMVDLFEST